MKKETYIDLGLPSKTLWKSTNEDGYFNYDEAISKFGSNLPTKKQLEELKNKCEWTWQDNGYKVTGPNGNSIFIPTMGYRTLLGDIFDVKVNSRCWSSTQNISNDAWGLCVYPNRMYILNTPCDCGLSVRLVK